MYARVSRSVLLDNSTITEYPKLPAGRTNPACVRARTGILCTVRGLYRLIHMISTLKQRVDIGVDLELRSEFENFLAKNK